MTPARALAPDEPKAVAPLHGHVLPHQHTQRTLREVVMAVAAAVAGTAASGPAVAAAAATFASAAAAATCCRRCRRLLLLLPVVVVRPPGPCECRQWLLGCAAAGLQSRRRCKLCCRVYPFSQVTGKSLLACTSTAVSDVV